MRVVLLENVEKLGSRFEVKDVADGYARNYLIPRGLAKTATDELLEWASDQQALQAEKAAIELEKVGDMASQMDGLEVEIPVKIGDKGQLFEKINSQKIAGVLKELGYEVKKNQVLLKDDIEELGEFDVKIKFAHNLETQIKVIVVEERNNSDKND